VGDELAAWLRRPESQLALRQAPALADVPGDPRFRQIMAPLSAIADLAGCRGEFDAAVRELVTGETGEELAPTWALMLADLRKLWPAGAHLLSATQVIEALHGAPSHRWDRVSTSRIGHKRIAAMMADAGITTRVTSGKRGYLREDIEAEEA
jgi:hypothetical protein